MTREVRRTLYSRRGYLSSTHMMEQDIYERLCWSESWYLHECLERTDILIGDSLSRVTTHESTISLVGESVALPQYEQSPITLW